MLERVVGILIQPMVQNRASVGDSLRSSCTSYERRRVDGIRPSATAIAPRCISPARQMFVASAASIA